MLWKVLLHFHPLFFFPSRLFPAFVLAQGSFFCLHSVAIKDEDEAKKKAA